MTSTGPGQIRQIGYLVPDLDTAIAHWVQHTGIGPWTVFRDVVVTGRHEGQDTAIEMDVGLSYRGELQIELIQPRNRAPSPYRTYVEHGWYGQHHIGFFSERFDTDLERAQQRGLRLVCQIQNSTGQRYAYLGSDQVPGLWIEFIELDDGFSMLLTQGIADAAHWDGTEPVREMT